MHACTFTYTPIAFYRMLPPWLDPATPYKGVIILGMMILIDPIRSRSPPIIALILKQVCT